MPSRGFCAAQAVTRTTVSPERTRTEPSACFAKRPVSMEIDRPPIEMFLVCMSVASRQSSLVPTVNRRPAVDDCRLSTTNDWRLTTSRLLLSNSQASDQICVALGVLPLQIVEQAAALTDELEQPAARVMILCVGL